MTIVDALKNLAVAFGCATSADEIEADTIAEVVQFIADNYTGA